MRITLEKAVDLDLTHPLFRSLLLLLETSGEMVVLIEVLHKVPQHLYIRNGPFKSI